LLNFLLLHSRNLRMNGEVLDIKIKVLQNMETTIISYMDQLLNSERDDLQIFDPFSTSGFNTTSTGIELFIVYDIITRGLNGSIKHGDGNIEIRFRNQQSNRDKHI